MEHRVHPRHTPAAKPVTAWCVPDRASRRSHAQTHAPSRGAAWEGAAGTPREPGRNRARGAGASFPAKTSSVWAISHLVVDQEEGRGHESRQLQPRHRTAKRGEGRGDGSPWAHGESGLGGDRGHRLADLGGPRAVSRSKATVAERQEGSRTPWERGPRKEGVPGPVWAVGNPGGVGRWAPRAFH